MHSRDKHTVIEWSWFQGRNIALVLLAFLVLAGTPCPAPAANGSLTGLIVDVQEEPMAGVEVFVYRTVNTRRPADYISPPSGEDGTFNVTLPEGTYWAVARLRGDRERFGPLQAGDKHSGAPREVEIYPGESTEEEFVVAGLEETSLLAVKYDTSFIRVEGTLQETDGTPVADAYAFANRNQVAKRVPDYLSAWTDNSGRYTLFLPEGTYYFGMATEFPAPVAARPELKVSIDSDAKNINIVTGK